ncbi:hypothetical protein K5X82_07935 [Halosquirtibacter xylanolyticus]|uniref:hypothetical protein n=1 Tax=Halosquirtibacter xylanolyticus TaxID=3374599 RepID=UPI003747ABE6|nr:hypothetical protein K5X82_07935 [Prolixibacteraceae bacterium]
MKYLFKIIGCLILFTSCKTNEDLNNIPNYILGDYKMVAWESSEKIDINKNGKFEDLLTEFESSGYGLGFDSSSPQFKLFIYNSGNTFFTYKIPKAVVDHIEYPNNVTLNYEYWNINSKECNRSKDQSLLFKTNITTKGNKSDTFNSIQFKNDTIIVDMTAELTNLEDPRAVYRTDMKLYYKKDKQ